MGLVSFLTSVRLIFSSCFASKSSLPATGWEIRGTKAAADTDPPTVVGAFVPIAAA